MGGFYLTLHNPFFMFLSYRKTSGFEKLKIFYLTETNLTSFCEELFLKNVTGIHARLMWSRYPEVL